MDDFSSNNELHDRECSILGKGVPSKDYPTQRDSDITKSLDSSLSDRVRLNMISGEDIDPLNNSRVEYLRAQGYFNSSIIVDD